MRRRPKHGSDAADVNVTPLLDIVFIMLIFFIVTATFVREEGKDVSRPQDNEQENQQVNTKVALIEIDDSNNVFFNRRQIDLRAVQSNVERFIAENPTGGLLISAAPTARTGLAVEVLDQANVACETCSVSITVSGT